MLTKKKLRKSQKQFTSTKSQDSLSLLRIDQLFLRSEEICILDAEKTFEKKSIVGDLSGILNPSTSDLRHDTMITHIDTVEMDGLKISLKGIDGISQVFDPENSSLILVPGRNINQLKSQAAENVSKSIIDNVKKLSSTDTGSSINNLVQTSSRVGLKIPQLCNTKSKSMFDLKFPKFG